MPPSESLLIISIFTRWFRYVMAPYKRTNNPINSIIFTGESNISRLLRKNIVPVNTIPEVIKIFHLNMTPKVETNPPMIGKYQKVPGYNKIVITKTNRMEVKIAFQKGALFGKLFHTLSMILSWIRDLLTLSSGIVSPPL